ncbi:MAG: hypothetical protein SFY69_03405 [Planctomycetota bacterium]|nr:hypothetical protein [Planctomycetota bacterium]
MTDHDAGRIWVGDMSEGELDILLTRVIDGGATDEDWRRLEALGARDPGVWRELAQAHRDDAVLRRGMARALDRAMMADLPDGPRAQERRTAERTRLAATWGGWAAAALVGLAVLMQRTGVERTPASDPAMAGVPVLSAADALHAYLEQGRAEGVVIEEMPAKWLVRSAPAADGRGFDVVYLRLIMERTQVPDLYKLSSDEFGSSVPIRITPEPPTPEQPPRSPVSGPV